MKITYYISLTLAMLLTVAAMAQSKDKGDRYFDKYEYDRALEHYMNAWEDNPTDPSISRKMAVCYNKINLPEMSAQWYEKTLALDQSEPNDMFELASALKRNKRYDEALLWFKKYNRLVPDDSRAARHLSYRKFFEKLKEDSMRFDQSRIKLNNDRSALGVTPFKDGKFLVSSGGYATDDDDELDYLPFLDVYVLEKEEGRNLSNPKLMGGGVNSR